MSAVEQIGRQTPGGVRIEKFETKGTFSLDGGTWDVDNNVYVIGNDQDAVVIDAPHEAGPILDAIGDRNLRFILLTHAHNDHITVVGELLKAHPRAKVALHPDDLVLWEQTYPDSKPSMELKDGQQVQVGDVELFVLHTPGHAPGAVCYYARDLETLFSGDTLFKGGPGATGRSYSDFPTIIESIKDKILSLPPETIVLPGHGRSTTVGDEKRDVEEWIRRGH